MAIKYSLPSKWIKYDKLALADALIGAKASVMSLVTVPYQKSWVDRLQDIQLKMEVAGTSRIEGADFTEHELEVALKPRGPALVRGLTKSQRQAHAALDAYRWISGLPIDLTVTEETVKHVHRLIVTGCDDDESPPGVIRPADHNVTFGDPRHRGAEGGVECQRAFSQLMHAVMTEFRAHDPLIQAIALHYHIAAMHPFIDGNGRTSRALESFMFQKAGLRETAFIAMSKYYYDEKSTYLATLALVRAKDHDLTDFLNFALRGLSLQCNRLLAEIKKEVQKALYKDTMFSLFNRLKSSRTRVIQQRQVSTLQLMLEVGSIDLELLWRRLAPGYVSLATPVRAFNRDIARLLEIGAINAASMEGPSPPRWIISINLNWPTEITESDFLVRMKRLPTGKTYSFLK